MLGTNDLKCRFSVSAFDIAESVSFGPSGPAKPGRTSRECSHSPADCSSLGKAQEFEEMFKGGSEKSQLFGKYYRKKP